MEHTGVVREVQGDEAVVEFELPRDCGSCFACSCSSVLEDRTRTVRVPRGDLEAGESVLISIPAYAGYLSMFLVFVLPLGLFVAGILVGGRLEGATGTHGGPTLAGGLAGFLAGFALAVAFNKKAGTAGYRVSRLMSSPDPAAESPDSMIDMGGRHV